MTRDGAALNPIARALWFIESHFAQDITLDDVAAVAGVSRYHLSRTFGLATGCGLMAYVRARRLSEAARALAAGAPDILAVALDWGYGSHEAFSRAFREQFDLTPDAVRTRGHVHDLSLMEALLMDDSMLTTLDPCPVRWGTPRTVSSTTATTPGMPTTSPAWR
jgi:AraC family transcriptional regulator